MLLNTLRNHFATLRAGFRRSLGGGASSYLAFVISLHYPVGLPRPGDAAVGAEGAGKQENHRRLFSRRLSGLAITLLRP